MADPRFTARTAQRYLILFSKGLAMGAADSVPGVSGGTIAVITRIYDELIYSLRSIDVVALRLLLQGQPRAAWAYINGSFLLVLLCGIVLSLRLSAGTVLWLMDNYYEPLMAFFIGLVLASSWYLKQRFVATSSATGVALVLGALLTIGVSAISPRASTEVGPVYLFFCGMLGICAMILPGLSGAFLLLLLGVYEYLLAALIAWHWSVILIFLSGCVLGLLGFSRLLSWTLRHYHDLSYAFLTGMLVASMWVLWPWQEALSFSIDSHGQLHALEKANLLPQNYLLATGQDPRWLAVLLALGAGLLLIIGFEKLFSKSVDV